MQPSKWTNRRTTVWILALCATSHLTGCASTGAIKTDAQHRRAANAAYVRKHYVKREYNIPMRDGVKLFTAVYTPKDRSKTYPMIMFRTPYSCRPYGEDEYRNTLGSGMHFTKEGFIFVYQDVRGRFLSEGTFKNMTPHIDNKESQSQVDESSDAYDSIEWLLNHVERHNGRVGMWGISYPGFYAASSMIDAHPALKAVSPQAPIADWWFDDFHHHGAFFLPHAFNFMATFGQARPEPTTEWGERFKHGTPDGYQFFMDLGPLGNANERYFHDEIAMWNNHVEHHNRDAFWQRRDILPHLNNVAPAVMTVGGWFDAEDLYGTFKIYHSVEARNPDVVNTLVIGPWAHGGWARGKGDHLGHAYFGSNASEFYQEHIELPFFKQFLKDEGTANLPEAYVFETGANRWRTFDHWPPVELESKSLFLHGGGGLDFDPPSNDQPAYDEYVSDPANPVPFTEAVAIGMTRAYMTDDQRFAGRRPDVLVYQTEVLDEDTTLAGPIVADLWVSTSGSDSDWVVKLIDVLPPDAEDYDDIPKRMHMGNYQMMVRSEVIRGRFRDSNVHPKPFTPNEPTNINLELLDVLHTFRKGHRIMVQIQSTWFPLVDRNPQTFVDNIFLANEEDFVKATQRIYSSPEHATQLRVGVLPTMGTTANTQP